MSGLPVDAIEHFVAKWHRREPEMALAEVFCPPEARARFRAWGALVHELREAAFELSDARVTAVKREATTEPSRDRPPPRTWLEPTVYDVFESDGTYLGEIHVPDRVQLVWIGRDEMWGSYRGELDETYVIRLRLTVE